MRIELRERTEENVRTYFARTRDPAIQAVLLQRNADPGPFPAPKQKFCRPHHKALSLLYDIQGPASSFYFFLLTAAQTIKKVLSSRHVRMDRTHTGKFDGESVRAALWRVRGSTANFVPRDCETEARPADETAEAEQGQRSAFCKPAATGAAKAGNRNH